MIVVSAGAVLAQSAPDPIIRDLWSRYAGCATDHIVSTANANPVISFEQRELSIRTACGHHVDMLRSHFARNGLNRQTANRIIGDAYRELAVGLRATHANTAARALAAREEVARAERERARIAESDRERGRLIGAAIAEHRTCISEAIVDLMIVSSEGAEAIATTAMARCREHEAKAIQLGIALYGADRAAAERIVAENVAKLRSEAVAAVVELRAAANRARETPPRPESPTPRPPDRPT